MHSFKKILIPTDFSPAAWSAVQLGIELSQSKHTLLTLLHVYPSMAKFGSRTNHPDNKDLENIEEIREQMDEFCGGLELDTKIKIQPVIIGGNVNKEIISYIKKNEFDLVIIGVNSSGRDNDPGSHTSQIISIADVPVLVVPNKRGSEKILVA